jgi:hypothetical protein
VKTGDPVVGAALAAGVFITYALGACPTIYVGDSGELVTAVHVLGIPHPTGYPLYVLVGNLWTLLLPVGSIAWRMSLFSAACAAAACGALYALARRVPLDRPAAAVAALVAAFAPSFWGEANVQRVYALAALFVVLATTTAWRWHSRRDAKSLVLTCFLCGLGATAHPFLAVYAGAFVVFAVVTEPAVLRRPGRLAAAGMTFLLGLVPYLYLPLRARMHPRLNWGRPESLDALLAVVTRRDFWHRAWLEEPSDLLVIAGDYLRSLGTELTWAGVALAVAGIFASRRRRWPVLLPVLAMTANVAVLAVHGSRSDLFIWHRYYIPSYLMGALLLGLGCQVVVERLPIRLRLLPLAIPAFLFASGWQTFDRSRYRIAEDFSEAVLRSLPPGAHLIATDDNVLFVLMYLHLVEGRRPDVDLILQGIGGAELPPLRFDPDVAPLFFTHHPNWRLPTLQVVPVGVVFRALRAGQPVPPPIDTFELDGEHDPRVPKDYLTQNLIGHFHYMLGETFAERDWLRAREEFAAAAAAAPDNDVLFYNLGLIFRGHGLLAEARAAFERSHAINPRPLASKMRAVASERLAELAVEEQRVAALEKALAGESPPRTVAEHARLATLLEASGEMVAARGHRLRARELEGGS